MQCSKPVDVLVVRFVEGPSKCEGHQPIRVICIIWTLLKKTADVT